MPASSRHLIVNADDLGQSAGCNEGILEAHELGIVTSASLMVRWPEAAAAVVSCRDHPCLSLGLHVDLGEWAFFDGAWAAVYEVVPSDDAALVAGEVDRQISMFRALVGRAPTHLDTHQHVHRHEPALSIMVDRARALSIPLRHVDPSITYRGDFYGQTATGEPYPEAITIEALLTVVRDLPWGWTELGCHPGRAEGIATTYHHERAEELRVLCHPSVRETVLAEGVELNSFLDIGHPPAGADER